MWFRLDLIFINYWWCIEMRERERESTLIMPETTVSVDTVLIIYYTDRMMMLVSKMRELGKRENLFMLVFDMYQIFMKLYKCFTKA